MQLVTAKLVLTRFIIDLSYNPGCIVWEIPVAGAERGASLDDQPKPRGAGRIPRTSGLPAKLHGHAASSMPKCGASCQGGVCAGKLTTNRQLVWRSTAIEAFVFDRRSGKGRPPGSVGGWRTRPVPRIARGRRRRP